MKNKLNRKIGTEGRKKGDGDEKTDARGIAGEARGAGGVGTAEKGAGRMGSRSRYRTRKKHMKSGRMQYSIT